MTRTPRRASFQMTLRIRTGAGVHRLSVSVCLRVLPLCGCALTLCWHLHSCYTPYWQVQQETTALKCKGVANLPGYRMHGASGPTMLPCRATSHQQHESTNSRGTLYACYMIRLIARYTDVSPIPGTLRWRPASEQAFDSARIRSDRLVLAEVAGRRWEFGCTHA